MPVRPTIDVDRHALRNCDNYYVVHEVHSGLENGQDRLRILTQTLVYIYNEQAVETMV